MSEPAPDATLAAMNEAEVARQVTEGKMPVAVLDHLGHLKHNIYSVACDYCTKPPGPR